MICFNLEYWCHWALLGSGWWMGSLLGFKDEGRTWKCCSTSQHSSEELFGGGDLHLRLTQGTSHMLTDIVIHALALDELQTFSNLPAAHVGIHLAGWPGASCGNPSFREAWWHHGEGMTSCFSGSIHPGTSVLFSSGVAHQPGSSSCGHHWQTQRWDTRTQVR